MEVSATTPNTMGQSIPGEPQCSTSDLSEEEIKIKDCSVARSNIYVDAVFQTKQGLDEIDYQIKRNEQLKADILVCDTDSDFDPYYVDLELFQ